jgi:hypothetical protein
MSMSDEMRQKLSEQAKARYAAKRAAEQPAPPVDPEPHLQAVPQPVEFVESPISSTEYADLLKQVNELKAELRRSASSQFTPQQNVQVNHQGKLTGTHDKYVVNPKNYPDPTPRLSSEPRLQRFAFPINYELEWNVSTTSYQTQDGVNMREPKFTIKLNRVVLNEEGEPTQGRYTLRQAIFHEDPQAAITVAQENGLEIDDFNEKDFLNEMRYLRIKAWLLEAFYPPKNDSKHGRKELVMGNQVVEYFEVAQVAGAPTMSFDQLKGQTQG